MKGLAKVSLAAWTALCLVAGCNSPPPSRGEGPESPSVRAAVGSPTGLAEVAKLLETGRATIEGAVFWPKVYSTQAVPLAVVTQSTISLIDQNTGVTVASGLTDNTGAFTLGTGGFVPAANSYYILEASKGLNAQLPGNVSVRLRTIMKWSGTGWLSITNGTVGGPINIHQLSTAIALEVGLGRIPVAATIDTVDTGSPPGLKVGSISGVAGLEIVNLATDVRNYITADLDPVNETNSVLPTFTTFSPSSGIPGTVVRIDGSGFRASAGGTTVSFNGTSATMLSITNKVIYALVPAGATSGAIQVRLTASGNTVSHGTAFSATPVAVTKVAVTGFGGAAVPVKPLTIFGSGFVPGGNTVTFAKVPSGTVNVTNFLDQGDSTAVTVEVPQLAASGYVTITNSGGTSAKVYLNVAQAGPSITEVFPNEAVAWGDVQLFGDRFGGARGTVKVDGFVAWVQIWTNKYVKFKVPYQVTAGQKTITLTDANGVSGTIPVKTYNGEVAYTSFLRVGTLPQGGVNLIPYFSGRAIYFAGGGGSNNISKLTVNPDGGPLAITNNVGTLPFGSGGADMTGDFQNWVGNKVYHFGNNSTTNKAILSFNTTTGDYESAVSAPSAWNTWPDGVSANFNEVGSTTGPKGLYVGGSYNAGANCRTYYGLYDGLNPDTLTGWTGYMQNPANPGCSADAVLMVLNDRLWWLSIYSQAYTNLDAAGRPDGWKNTGPPVTNYYFGNFTAAGQYIWTFGKWCYGSEVSRTIIDNGNTPRQNNTTWERLANANVGFGGAGNQLVVGKWMYFVGGACGNDNVIHAAPITQ